MKLKERFADILKNGPPQEPTPENFGPIGKALENLEKGLKDDGQEVTAHTLVYLLALILDHRFWMGDVESYRQIEKMVRDEELADSIPTGQVKVR